MKKGIDCVGCVTDLNFARPDVVFLKQADRLCRNVTKAGRPVEHESGAWIHNILPSVVGLGRAVRFKRTPCGAARVPKPSSSLVVRAFLLRP